MTDSENKNASLLIAAMAWLGLALPALLFLPSVADAAISVTGFLFLILSWRSGDFTWLRQPWVIAGLAFWVLAIARGLISSHPANSAPIALAWVRFVIFAAALQAVARGQPRFTPLMLWSLVAISLLGAADTVFQLFAGHDVFGRPKIFGRLTGPTSRPAIGLLLLMMGLPVLALMTRELSDTTRSAIRRLAALTGILLLSAAIFLSGERMTFVLLIAALVACAAIIVRPSWRFAGALAAATIVIASVFYAAFPQVWARHISLLMIFKNPSDILYLDIWQTAWRMFTEHPLLGVGVHNFRADCAQYTEHVSQVCGALHPHQFWLEWLAETGVVGTALLILLFIAALKAPVRLWRNWRSEPLLAGAALAVLLRLWPIATTHSFFISQNEVVFWTMLALAVASAEAGGAARRP